MTLNRDFLCRIAKECGCSDSAIVKIKSLNMARELWNSIVPHDRDKLMNRIVELCHGYCSELLPGVLNPTTLIGPTELFMNMNVCNILDFPVFNVVVTLSEVILLAVVFAVVSVRRGMKCC